jgi:hypothetical protein
MEREEKKKKQHPPYLPVSLLDQFFKKIRTVNVPDFIDVKTLQTWGIATKQEYFLISALGFLGLIDEQLKPTSEFANIQMEGNQFKTNLKEIVEKAYSDVFKAYKIEHLTSEDLINFFGQNYSQRSKYRMVKPFAYLCKLAGIESPAFRDIAIRQKDQTKEKKRKTSKKPAHKESEKRETETQTDEIEPAQGKWREYSHPLGKLRINVDASEEVVNEFIDFLKYVVLKNKTEG